MQNEIPAKDPNHVTENEEPPNDAPAPRTPETQRKTSIKDKMVPCQCTITRTPREFLETAPVTLARLRKAESEKAASNTKGSEAGEGKGTGEGEGEGKGKGAGEGKREGEGEGEGKGEGQESM